MSAVSSPDRVSHAFIRYGVIIALVAFLVVGSDVLLDQWITGNARTEFILGTAALIAGICLGLFAVVAAIGLVVATVMALVQRRSPDDQSDSAGAASATSGMHGLPGNSGEVPLGGSH